MWDKHVWSLQPSYSVSASPGGMQSPLHSDHPAIPNVGNPWAAPGGGTVLWPQVHEWKTEAQTGCMTRLEVHMQLVTGPGTKPQSQVSCPKRAALSSQGERSEWGLALQLFANRACSFCSFMQCQVANGQRVLQLGSLLVFPCFQKDHFLQPALAEPREWCTLDFLRWFKSTESHFAFSNYTS